MKNILIVSLLLFLSGCSTKPKVAIEFIADISEREFADELLRTGQQKIAPELRFANDYIKKSAAYNQILSYTFYVFNPEKGNKMSELNQYWGDSAFILQQKFNEYDSSPTDTITPAAYEAYLNLYESAVSTVKHKKPFYLGKEITLKDDMYSKEYTVEKTTEFCFDNFRGTIKFTYLSDNYAFVHVYEEAGNFKAAYAKE